MPAPVRVGVAIASFALMAVVFGLGGARSISAGVVDDVKVTVTLSGNGMGYLRTDDGFINCVRSGGISSGTCTYTYHLTESIPFGYIYASEVNSCYVVGGSCVTGGTGPSGFIGPGAPDQVLGVEFRLLDPVAIQVKKAGTGSGTVKSTPRGINCGSDCKSDFPKDESFTIKATASSGSKFVKWSSGPCSGQGSTCTFNASSAVTVTATFDKKLIATPAPTAEPTAPPPTEAPVVTDGPTAVVPTPFPTAVETAGASGPLETAPPETSPAADDSGRSTLILVLGSLLVVILAAGGLYAMRSQKPKASPPA